MKSEIKRIILYFFITILAYPWAIFSGFVAGTKISIPSEYCLIETLAIGDIITGYDSINNLFPSVTVKNITTHTTTPILAITTNKGIIYTSLDQLFYEVIGKDYKAAKDLTVNSILLTQQAELCECVRIESYDTSELIYDVTLDTPHLFFSSDAQVLTHNFAPAAPLVIPTIEAIFGLGAAIGCVYLDKQPQIVQNIDSIKNQIINFIRDFRAKYYKNNKPFRFNHENFKTYIPFNPNPSTLAGIKPDPKIYFDMLSCPLRYGPMYPLGKMTNSGDIECTLYVMRFDHWNKDDSAAFTWQELGKQFFNRDDSFVKVFVDTEDKKELDNLQICIKSWPLEIVKNLFTSKYSINCEAEIICDEFGCFDTTICGVQFGVHALYRMAQKKISPLLVLHILKVGKYMQANILEHLICFDQQKNVAIVLNKKSKIIINVGHYNDLVMLNEENASEEDNTKTDIDILSDNNIHHIKQPKHNWNKLVPDGNWEKIKKIMKDVIKTGQSKPFKQDVCQKVKTIAGEIVEITYRDLPTGERKIGNAWVK